MIKAVVRLTAFLIAISICSMVSAHIGDTKQKCIERYGKPVNKVGEITVYESGEFRVFATFFDGEADSIGYGRKERNVGLTKSEIKSFLESNGGDKIWVEAPDKVSWITIDAALLALYGEKNGILTISTRGRLERKKEKSSE